MCSNYNDEELKGTSTKELKVKDSDFVRVNFTIPSHMRDRVKSYAKKAGISVSELIRGSLDGIMALTEAGVDFGKQLEKGIKDGLEELKFFEDELKKDLEKGLKGLESLKGMKGLEKLKEFEHLKAIEANLDFNTAEFEQKMDEFGKKMEEYVKRIGEKVQISVNKALGDLKREFPHVRRIMHVRPPKTSPASYASLFSADSQGDLGENDLERKLEKLKGFLDNELITKDDYDKKKTEILNRI